ncbi:DUF6773 family protein [Holzapfeliella sp. JNUCC 72]
MQKESLYIRAIKRFYGVQEVDEYREQEINKIGNKAFMILAIYNMISVFVAVLGLMSSLDKELTFLSYIGCNFIVLLAITGYAAIRVYRLRLDQIESYDSNQYGQLIKKVKMNSLSRGVFFFIGIRILTIVMDLVDVQNKSSLTDLILSPKGNVQGLIATVIFAGFMYVLMKSRIKKDE